MVARDVPFVTGLRRELDVGRVVVPTARRGRDTLRVAAGLRAPERGAAVALEVALTAGGFLEVALRSRQAFNLAARLAAAPCMATRDPAHPLPNSTAHDATYRPRSSPYQAQLPCVRMSS